MFGYLSFALHFGDFIRGLVRSEAVVFYLVVSAIALTLNTSLSAVAALTWTHSFRSGLILLAGVALLATAAVTHAIFLDGPS